MGERKYGKQFGQGNSRRGKLGCKTFKELEGNKGKNIGDGKKNPHAWKR